LPKVFFSTLQQLLANCRCGNEIKLKKCQKVIAFRFTKLSTPKRAFFIYNLEAADLVCETIGTTFAIANLGMIFIYGYNRSIFTERAFCCKQQFIDVLSCCRCSSATSLLEYRSLAADAQFKAC
jgi:hypothetical protein